ncbi:MAG: DUF4838 domain-containing protein, partial [Victivallales bacterium]|nr:DUF4838 domain-containing protein [Victivallales bacterium]
SVYFRIIKIMKKILYFHIVVWASALVFGEPVSPGRDYTVVFSVNATRQEVYSARLLAEKLGKMCGTRVEATQEDGASGKIISVGETEFAKRNGLTAPIRAQGYSIDVKGQDIFIRGGHPGPLNGVVSFLQEDLGFRYYAEPQKEIPAGDDPGEIFIPDWSRRLLEVTARSYAPPFEVRELLYNYAHLSDPESLVYLRQAPISYLSYLPKESGGVQNSKYFVHSYYQLVPANEHYEKHPEYFALQNGKRVRQTATYGSICYTNPDVINVMADKLRKELEANPNLRYISVSVNDGSTTICECDRCAPEIKKYGLPGMQLIVANKIAELLVKDYPDIRLTTLVYGNGKLDPGKVKAHPNVVLFLAPIGARYNNVKMLVPLDENPDVVKCVSDCFKSSSNVYFWDYLETDDMPFPTFDQFAKSVKFLADCHVTGYFADCTNGGKSLTPLKKWLYCQLLWNPAQDIEALIQEFVNAYYGKAAPEILEYIALIRKAWRRFDAELKAAGTGVVLSYAPEEIGAMTELFESALRKVEGDSVHTGRVAREYIPLIGLKLAGNPVVVGVDEYKGVMERGKKLAKYMLPRSVMKKQKWIEKWERKVSYSTRTPEPTEYSRNTVTVWKPLVVNGMSDYLDDTAAAKGNAARHIGKKPWGIQWYYNTFIDYMIPGKEYVLRIRFRVEQKMPRANGKVFEIRAFHHGGDNSQPPMSADFDKKKDASGEYRTAVLGKVIVKNPLSTGMFWMNSLVDSDEAVWYERLELIPMEEFKEKDIIPNVTIIL